MRTIVKNGLLITLDKESSVPKNGCLIFDDDIITYLGEQPDDLSNIDQVIDAKGNIVMPGLINTHSHAAMSLLRGYSDDLPLKDWLEKKMWPMEAKFKQEHIHLGTELAVIEMLKTGTTTFADMYAQMDIVAEVVKHSGIRGSLSRGIIGLVSEQEQISKLTEAIEFAKRWRMKGDGRISTMISPHSLYTCPPDFIKEIVKAAEQLNLPIHIHMSETSQEVKQNVNQYGKRPVKHLFELGVFEQHTLVAHAVHINDEEIDVIKSKNVKVSHNPGSNLKLGSGIAPVPKMLEKGIHVALGTDSAASNNNLDMFEEMRLAALIQKGYLENPIVIPASVAIKMATIYGAEALGIDKYTGTLEVGKKADFIIVDNNQPHFLPTYNPISSLVYSASGKDVKYVFVNGKQIVKNGEILTLDEEKTLYEVTKLTSRWK